MFGLESLNGTALAVALIGIVLVEALTLYVGYGALQRLFGPRLMKVIRGE
jgi:hypothetical protein